MDKEALNKFEGWAVVELFGHAKEVGFVTTESFGVGCLFRIDVPALAEREFILHRPEYTGDGNTWTPSGSKVKREAVPARSRLVGVGAVYSITPCTEETAMRAIEDFIRRPLILLELPKDSKQLPGETQDRTFTCCSGNPEDGHADDCPEGDDDER